MKGQQQMKQTIYAKGNSMTFPLELTEIRDNSYTNANRYLYPREVLSIQSCIEEACDRMEYDGSLMYDEYPDKVSVQAISDKICRKVECPHQEEISNRWMHALVQMMLCNEMSYRRERRKCHKNKLAAGKTLY